MIDDTELRALVREDAATLIARVGALFGADAGDMRVSYSRKVFIPLTRLCRDVCLSDK